MNPNPEPNHRPALDAAIAFCLYPRHSRRASEAGRWAAEAA